MADAGLRPGLSGRADWTVGPGDTAAAVGSGDLEVLGSPRLLAWMEGVTCDALRSSIDAGQTSVGTRMTLEHLRPSPLGAAVTVSVALQHVDGRLVRFEAVATDADGAVVGRGEITRVIVERERFLARVAG